MTQGKSPRAHGQSIAAERQLMNQGRTFSRGGANGAAAGGASGCATAASGAAAGAASDATAGAACGAIAGTTKVQDYFGALFSDTSINCLTRIAENISMPASMLEQLALHSDSSVREAVADNPNTPLDTMWLLARDESVDVRYAIAENHNVALAILTFLCEDENPYVACRARATMDRLWGCSILDRGYWRRSERAAG